jgi:ATP-dependent Clp protease protease subunit
MRKGSTVTGVAAALLAVMGLAAVSCQSPRTGDQAAETERVVRLNGTITDENAMPVITKLLLLARDAPGRPIHLSVDSPGGAMGSAMAITETMASLSAKGTPVHTRCPGQAGGAAALIVASGDKGHRSAARRARFHMVSLWLPNTDTVDAKVQEKANLEVARKFAVATGRDAGSILKDMAGKLELDALRAKDYGLVDDVAD